MSGPEFTAYFLRFFWEGYRREHALDPAWLCQLPDLFLRRHFSVWVGNAVSGYADPDDMPWRGLRQYTAELEDPSWLEMLFEPTLRELVG